MILRIIVKGEIFDGILTGRNQLMLAAKPVMQILFIMREAKH